MTQSTLEPWTRTQERGCSVADLPARITRLSFASDGLLVAPARRVRFGLLRLEGEMLYLDTGRSNRGWTTVSDDGNVATALDSGGGLFWIDLQAVRNVLH